MPLPAPLPLWAKVVIQVAPFALAQLYDYVTDHAEHDAEDMEWRRVQLVFTRTAPSGYGEDVATTKFDIMNITGGAPDSTWTTGDYTACETALNTWWTSTKTLVSANHTLKEFRWYRMRFAPILPGITNPKDDKPFVDALVPQRITTVGAVGTNATSAYNPYQVSSTLTLKTALPRHWGRCYVPGIGNAYVDTNGRWTSGFVTSFSSAAGTLLTSLQASDMFPVVPVRQHDGMIARALLTVGSLQVDNLPDIQRRRRPSSPSIRTTVP